MSKTTRLVQIALRPQNTQVFQAWTLRRASKQTAFCEKLQVLPRTCLRNSICVSCRCLWPIWTSLPTIKNKKILRLLCFIIWIVPHWSKSLDFTYFGENAVTSIFAKGWDSLGLSKKIVNETAKIGQKMNPLLLAKMPSLWFSPVEGNH